jgi:hypothetical protein
VNNEDPDDEHHVVRLYDFFYYKVSRARGVLSYVCPRFWVERLGPG